MSEDSRNSSSKDAKQSQERNDAGKNLIKETAKKSLSEGGKSLASKAGGTVDPKAQLLSGAQEAAQAAREGDGLGVADAGIRTAAVAGATALGGTVAGAAADFILKTKAGRKLTRAVTLGIGVSVFLMLSVAMMVVLVVGGAVSAILGGSNQQVQSLYDPQRASAISDPVTLVTIDAIIKRNIKEKLPIDDAVLATMDYLSKTANSSSASRASGFSINTFYNDIAKNKVIESTASNTAGNAPTATLVPGTSATSVAPWDSITVIDPTLVDPNNGASALVSALFYETAYKTITNELTTNKAFQSSKHLANQVSDWTPTLEALITQDNITANGTIGNPLDSSGNLITSGIRVDPNSKFKDGPPLGPGNLFSLDYAYSLIGHASLVCPDGTCNFQCEKIAEYVYHKVGIFDPAYNDWRWMVTNGQATLANSPNGMSPPVGALMFWDPTPAPGALGRDGHVGVYLGGGLVLSNWDNGDGKGLNIWAVKASEMFNSRWPYLGWAYPNFPNKAPAGYNDGQ